MIGPNIKTDNLILYVDGANTKSHSGNQPVINLCPELTTWDLQRSNITDVTGTFSNVPYGNDKKVWKCEVATASYANTLHRIEDLNVIGDLGNQFYQYTMWVRGDTSNSGSVGVSIDISDNTTFGGDSVTLGTSSTWVKLNSNDNPGGTYNATKFFDMFITSALDGDIIYVTGISICRVNVGTSSNLVELLEEPGEIDYLSTKNDTWYSIKNNNEMVIGDYVTDYGSYPNNLYTKSGGNIRIPNTPLTLRGNPEFTICGFFKINSDYNLGSIWGIGGDASVQGINTYNNTYTNEVSIDLWGNTTFRTGATMSTTEWTFCSWSKSAGLFNNTTVKIFVNDTKYTGDDLITIRGGSATPNINNKGIVIGRAGYDTDNYYSLTHIGNFMVYDVSLSDTNILEIFNAHRPRFNI